MFSQYPYTLEKRVSADTGRNTDGSIKKGPSVFVEVAKCRNQANAKGSVVRDAEGKDFVFDSVIYFPKIESEQAPASGDWIRVTDGNTIRLEGEVVRCQIDQLHSRIWL